MAIFTKDGKMYMVEGPNPLVKKQVSWDPSKLVFHNFRWDEIRNGTGATQEPTEEIGDSSEFFERETKEFSAPAEQSQEPKSQHNTPAKQKKAESPEGDREFDLPYIKYKVLCHCLPAKMEHRADSFYGESWGRIKYGKKFVFPCVVISSTDLSFEFWTSDPRGQVAEKSVIYPFSYEVHNKATNSYDKVPYDDYRWWRVETKEAKEGGWLFRANPSDIQPDFSD
jgi:hypothetical protein